MSGSFVGSGSDPVAPPHGRFPVLEHAVLVQARAVSDLLSRFSALAVSQSGGVSSAPSATVSVEDLDSLRSRLSSLEGAVVSLQGLLAANESEHAELVGATSAQGAAIRGLESLSRDVARFRADFRPCFVSVASQGRQVASLAAQVRGFGALSPRLTAVESSFRAFAAHQESVGRGLETAICVLASHISGFQASVDFQRGGLSSLQRTVGSQHAALVFLRTTVTSQREELASLRTTVISQREELTSLRTAVASRGEELASLRATVAARDGALASLQASVSFLQSRLGANDTVSSADVDS
jgi:chromosome segregation ATPase